MSIKDDESDLESEIPLDHPDDVNQPLRVNDNFPAEHYFEEPLFEGRGKGRYFNADRKIKFLRHLAKLGVVAGAARATGITVQTAYNARKDDQIFRTAWEDALATYADSLEIEAYRRAVKGVEEPVFYRGEEIAVVRKYSDNLLALKLKGRRPEMYRERVSVDADVRGHVSQKINLGKLSDEQLEALETALSVGLEGIDKGGQDPDPEAAE